MNLGASIHSKISHLLSLSLYKQALVLLFDLYINKTPTKLGSLQRWVRDCDATRRPGKVLTREESEERTVILQCLDMVLRVCGGDVGDMYARNWIERQLREEESHWRSVIQEMSVFKAQYELDGSRRFIGRLQAQKPLWSLIQKGFESESDWATSSQ